MSLPVVMAEFRVAADPTLRFAPSGVAVCTMRAVASSRKKVGEEWVDDKACWVNLTGFKQVAENMVESFVKGNLVVVVGKISTDDWEDKDGGKRTSVNIVVDSIGASVAWDTVTITKTERSSSSGGGSAQRSAAPDPANDPWAAPAGQSDDPPPF